MPVQVTGLISGVTAVAAGGAHSCAVVNGRAQCWGYNGDGRLGNNNTAVSCVPVATTSAPDAPAIGPATAGIGSATVSYTPPAFNGGATITSFTATSNPGGIQASAPGGSIVVNGLTNGTAYTFTVTATNVAGVGPPSAASNSVTPAAPSLTLIGVRSRKVHGPAGTYDLPLDPNVPISGAVTVESRAIGTGHTIVFQFSGPVTSVGGVSSNPVGTATFAIPASPGNEVVVTLTGVPDNSRPTITLSNINGSGANVAAAIGFLIGDVNNTLSVNASDISGMKARLNQNANPGNFKFDVNTSGVINATDLSAVKARSGLVLPP